MGFFIPQTPWLTWHEADVARGTRAELIFLRSWPRSSTIMVQSKRKSWPRSLAVDGHDHRAIMATNRHPITDQTARHFWAKILFKNRCSSPYFVTLAWIVKELTDLKERSWVIRHPPTFKLNCEAIGAGLITNFHLISSNFPLEFRTSARKKSSKFASIGMKWSPIIAEIRLVVIFDQLSSGNLRFY